MTLSEIRAQAIVPAMALLPLSMKSQQAEVMLLAIGLQESRFTHRRQVRGPARGFWQFEQGGGVRGVLTHALTRDHAQRICRERGVTASASAVHSALEHDDVLAAVFARLLLWSDPFPLPALGKPEQPWGLYIRTWRPGKPHRHTWDALYAQALAEVVG